MMSKLNVKNNFKFLNLINDFTKSLSRNYTTENLVKIEHNQNTLKLHLGSSSSITDTLKFDALWLRFNCHAPSSKTQDSNQRIIDAEKIPKNLTIKNCQTDKENVYIDWNQDSTTKTVIPIKYMLNYYPYKTQTQSMDKVETSMISFDYNKIFVNGKRNDDVFREVTKYLLTHGTCLIKNVPTKNGMVVEMGKQLGPIQSTLYGDYFDVKATPNPINLAYSDSFLCLHQDLVYYESPPGLQLLHCIQNGPRVDGGESVVLDGIIAAQEFREQYPEYFDILTKVPATFQKILVNKTQLQPLYMVHKKPHIVLNHRNKIIGINWAPQNEGPIVGVGEAELKKYYEAYIEFTKFLNNNKNKIEFLMKAGDLFIFNNRRMLHSRKSFKLHEGVRHLQGAYVNMDLFKSEVLLNEYNKTKSEEELLTCQNTILGNFDYNDGL